MTSLKPAIEPNVQEPPIFSWHALARLIRWPNLLIIALTQYLGAIFLVGPQSTWLSYLLSPMQATLTSATVFITAAGYLINDYYDIKIDFLNRPEEVVVGKRMKRRSVMVLHLLFNFGGVFLGFLLSPLIGIVCFLAASWLWIYSAQLKRLPFVGNLSVALLTALSVCLLAFYYQQSVMLIYTFALFAGALTLVREIVKDMEDMKGDAAFGCRTLPIVLGLRPTKKILYGLIALFIFLLVAMAAELQNPIAKVFFLALIIPTAFWIYALVYADKRKDYHRLSTYCKLLMLAGVLSMLFF